MGASGTTTVDFGAFPGKSDASVAVTGQAGIVAGSLVEAWIRPADTADHLHDEHMVEPMRIIAGNIVAGVGFTIYGFNASQVNEPVPLYPDGGGNEHAAGADLGRGSQDGQGWSGGGVGTRIYGQWSVAWVWN